MGWFVLEFWRFVFVQQEVASPRPDRNRVSAAAEGRKLQPRRCEGANRGSSQATRRSVKILLGRLTQIARRPVGPEPSYAPSTRRQIGGESGGDTFLKNDSPDGPRCVASRCSAALLSLPGRRALPVPIRLPSWNETAPKAAIVEFVEKVSKAGWPDFVPVPERIAVFDNDGTLWTEHPMYVQLAFALDRVKAEAPNHPEWATTAAVSSGARGRHDGRLPRPAKRACWNL